MPTLETIHGTIAYDELGEGPPLVLLSSGAHVRGDFAELRELLAPNFRTIAPDWPGHGDSPAGTGAGTAMAFADVAEALVAELAPQGAVVFGCSVGGFSAARLAIRRPELVTGLVLADAGGFAPRTPLLRSFCALMSRPGFLKRIYPAFAKRYMRPRTDADQRAMEAAIATTRADPGLRTVAELWGSFASPEHDLRRDAGSIAAPTLVVWGRRDPVIPLRIGKRVAAAVPGARLVVLDTGHLAHTSDPRGLAAELAGFVSSGARSRA